MRVCQLFKLNVFDYLLLIRVSFGVCTGLLDIQAKPPAAGQHSLHKDDMALFFFEL